MFNLLLTAGVFVFVICYINTNKQLCASMMQVNTKKEIEMELGAAFIQNTLSIHKLKESDIVCADILKELIDNEQELVNQYKDRLTKQSELSPSKNLRLAT